MSMEQHAAARVERDLPRLLHLAVRHAAAGALPEARKMIWSLLRIVPTSAEAWHAFAAVLHRQGNALGAGVAVSRALQLDEAFAMAHALKADLLLCASQVEKARYHLARATDRPDKLSPEMHRWAVAMHRRLDRERASN